VVTLLVELFEVETAQIFEKVVADIHLLHIEFLEFEGLEFSQLLMAKIQYILAFVLGCRVFVVEFSPNEGADFLVSEHAIIF